MKENEKTIFSKKYQKLIKEIVSIREKRGMTQRTLAKILNVPHSRVAMIELCQRRIDILELVDILKAMDVSDSDYIEIMKRLYK